MKQAVILLCCWLCSSQFVLASVLHRPLSLVCALKQCTCSPVYLWYAGSTTDVKGATGKRGPPANVAFGGSLASTKSRLQGSTLGSTQPASPMRARPRQVRLTCPCQACEQNCQSSDIACQLRLSCKCSSAAMRLMWCTPHTDCSSHSVASTAGAGINHTQLSLSGLHDGIAHVPRKMF